MGWDAAAAVDALRKNAQPHSTGRCAHYTVDAIEAGGLKVLRTPSAKDLGQSLIAAGFSEVPASQYGFGFCSGDVAIVQPIAGHPHGHAAMFDGGHWYSDFKQNSFSCPPDPYPGPSYRAASPTYKVYRR